MWWLLLAEPLLERALLMGASDPSRPATAAAAGDVSAALLTSGALLYAAVWAVAAVPLPWLVRGRRLAPDVVLASAWAGGLAAATAAVAQSLGAAEPRRLAAGAALAGALAVALPRLLGPPAPVEP
jgi:hypothetical protein